MNKTILLNRTVTLVMDFCHNLDHPHLGGEQPGDIYIIIHQFGFAVLVFSMFQKIYSICSQQKKDLTMLYPSSSITSLHLLLIILNTVMGLVN